MSTFKLPPPHPTLSRNGFDKSSRRVFSAPAGALLPILTEEVNPGEHFSFSVQDLVRTQPLNTAAFARCKEYYHFFFIPYRALWSGSDRFFTGVANGDRTFLDPKNFKGDVSTFSEVPESVPCFELFSFLDSISKAPSVQFGGHDGNSQSNNNPNPNPPSTGGASPIAPHPGGPGGPGSSDDPAFRTRGSNPKGTGFKPAFRPGNYPSHWALPGDRVFQGSAPLDHKLDPNKDALGYSYAYGAFRLLNHLEYGVSSDGYVYAPSKVGKENKSLRLFFPLNDELKKVFSMDLLKYRVSALRPLAYQRIYNDFYRNQQWEKADPTCFNVDYLYKGGLIDTEAMKKIFTLRYRYWQKDWLTSALPSINYNEGIFKLPSYAASADVDRSNFSTTVNSHLGTFSVADIKAAFALDKMLEATRRANGLDYSSQIAAHYGFKVPESRRDCAQFIGGFDNAISISEVLSTSNGSIDNTKETGTFTGQIFGKGIGSMNSGRIDFDVKEHGLIMCIYSIAPQVDYNAESMSPFNRKLQRMDYFQPEFQNLGLQPILQSDLCFTTNQGVNNSVLGYTSRYAEYKNSKDLVFGEFQTAGTLSAWTTPRMSTYTYDGKLRDTTHLSLSNFFVDPKVLDPIFAVQYDGRTCTDQFMINSYIDVKAVRPMSVVGSMNL